MRDPNDVPRSVDALQVDGAGLRRRGAPRHVVRAELDPQWLGGVLADTDAEVVEPGRVEIELLIPIDGAVVASGELRTRFTVPCGRCLQPAWVDAGTRLQATYVAGPLPGPHGRVGADEGEDGIGLNADDLNTWAFDGATLHLDGLVAEHVKLAYPMRALCSHGEACRGLCSGCGHDLNDQDHPSPCGQCGRVVEGPVADSSGPAQIAPGADGPLAQALRKLRLPE
jgi:uncharacterized protein